jgi:hypothetical protein
VFKGGAGDVDGGIAAHLESEAAIFKPKYAIDHDACDQEEMKTRAGTVAVATEEHEGTAFDLIAEQWATELRSMAENMRRRLPASAFADYEQEA